jgi:beta-galactosidase
MQPLKFDQTSYIANGERIFLISGELHYFRVPHRGWKDRLQKLKDAGGNCAATYVPWLLHETEEGKFSFGEAQLDFERFLELCQEVGLWAVVRPGPYQYSELLHGGLPHWLLAGYPEILAQKLDGSPINPDLSVSYLHPTFLEKTRRWLEAVTPRLEQHQFSRGGAVAAVQIDNELMGIHEWFGNWDYHPESMGVGRETGRWTGFLKRRYDSLGDLNQDWGTRFQNWAEALPLAAPAGGGLADTRRLKDYNDFYFTVAADFMALLGGWLRELGIDAPLIHNSGGPGMNAYFEETLKEMGSGFLLGSDHYYNLGLDWGDGTHPTPKYASKVFYSLEMLKHLGMPPTVFELPGGSAMDFPPILGHDLEAAYLVNLAYGMKGYNIYVFAGGANPPGAADPSVGMSVYDYGAGISPEGELRELYHVEKKVAGFIHAHPWLAQGQRLSDCRLGLVREYARSNHYATGESGLAFSNNAAWTLMRKGLMMTAFCASLSPELADMDSDDWLTDTAKPLMLACGTSLSRSIQERLVRFLEGSGKLILAPGLPELDETFHPCTILAEYLKASKPVSSLRPAGAEPVIHDACSGLPIGWEARLDSGGVVLLLERTWVMGRHWDAAMLRQAVERLAAPVTEPPYGVVACDNPNVWTSLLSDGEHGLLFIMNLFSGPLTCTVRFRHPQTGQWLDTGKHTLPGISVKTLDMH